MKKLVALLAVLGMVSVASADLMVNISSQDAGNGLIGYTVNLDAGYQIYGVDVKFEGPMNQLGLFGTYDTPTLTTAKNLSFVSKDTAQDTHFLFEDADIMAVADPGSGISYAPKEIEGVLSAVFVPTGTNIAKADPWDLAYIVLPAGETALMTISISNDVGIIESEVVTIPEPATIGLLAVGVVGLLRRKLA